MAIVNAKCTVCGKTISINGKNQANICPNCNQAIITENAVRLYLESPENEKGERPKKHRHRLRSLGRGLLFALECLGYLFYVLFFIWLFIDLTDNVKKK